MEYTNWCSRNIRRYLLVDGRAIHCAAREPTIAYVTGTEWERFGSFVIAMTIAALETSAQLM